MKSVVIGASAGLGRALAEELAQRGDQLFLVSSNLDDLAPIAADLTLRYGVSVTVEAADITTLDPEAFRDKVHAALGPIDNLLLIAGISLLDKDKGPMPPADLDRLIAVNFTAPLRIANVFLPDLTQSPAGNFIGAGSVAAVRGRRNNMVYAAAKRGFECYADSVRHYLAGQNGAKVQFYRLGYLKTRMTAGQKLPFPALDPSEAAKSMVANMGKDLGSVYLPRWWIGIMSLIQALPWALFKKLDI